MSGKSSRDSENSETELAPDENVSVFDFLYVDHDRVGTFLSQFNNFGHLTGVVNDRSAGKSKSSAAKMRFSGNAGIAKAENELDEANSAEHNEANQRMYDPKWANALELLDELSSRNMLVRDVEDAALGDVVLFSGPLRIRDLGVMEKVWELNSIKGMINAASQDGTGGNRQQRRAQGKKGKRDQEPSEIDLFFDLVKVMPHSTQMYIGEKSLGWASLESRALTVPASDFMVKYGGEVPGRWNAVGVLDARPDQYITENEVADAPELDEAVSSFLDHLGPIVRQLLGRPNTAYGFTPLLVFREVGANPS